MFVGKFDISMISNISGVTLVYYDRKLDMVEPWRGDYDVLVGRVGRYSYNLCPFRFDF
jgi:hypothetical protein